MSAIRGVVPIRSDHILRLMSEWGKECNKDVSFRIFTRDYAKANMKKVSGTDRGAILKTCNHLLRWRDLLDVANGGTLGGSWRTRYYTYSRFGENKLLNFDKKDIPLHTKLCTNELLLNHLCKAYGKKIASDICKISNTDAVTTLCINSLKVESRDVFIDILKKQDVSASISKTRVSKLGIYYESYLKYPQWLPSYLDGSFEIQDESSQLVSSQVKAVQGDTVLDFNAGSGTKALNIALQMKSKGTVYLMDKGVPKPLKEAKAKMKRAGVFNVSFVDSNELVVKIKKLKADWILIDAPSTATGTIRRNPDIKWNFSEKLIEDSIKHQRMLVEKALPFLKKGGKIVYSTNSLLPIENEMQVMHFVEKHNLQIVGDPLKMLPIEKGADGCFAVTLERKPN